MTTNIREAVLAEVETKIAAGEALSGAVQDVARAQEALDEANAALSKARQHALKSGWTEGELKKLGLVPATRSARSKSSRTTRTTRSSEDAPQMSAE